MTQFSRSMHVECWGTGVDFLVITPYYILSHAQTKRGAGTLIAPQPIKLVKGALSQLGKQYIWQGHGYWFHGFLGNFAAVYWGTTARWRKMMKVRPIHRTVWARVDDELCSLCGSILVVCPSSNPGGCDVMW